MNREKQERQSKILSIVNKNQEISREELEKLLGVTELTINRDLLILEQQGLLYRTQNGVVKKNGLNLSHCLDLDTRGKLHQKEKTQICKEAALQVNDGDSLFIDGGSTTQIFASLLSQKKDLLVFTNTSIIGNLLKMDESKNNKVILIGGRCDSNSYATLGDFAEHVVSQFFVNKVFIGTSGIDLNIGFTAAYADEGRIKHLMIEQGTERYILADSSKFEDYYPYPFCSFSEDVMLITDSGITQQQKTVLKKTNMKLNIV